MKYKGLYLLCFLILPLCLVVGATAYAVSNPVGQPTNAVNAKIEKYKVDNKADGDIDLDRYRALFHKESDWNPFGKDEVAETVNNVTNFFFEINKLIVSITDYGIENLYQLDVLDDFADKIGQFVGDIYQKLLSNIVMTLFIIICLNAFIIYSVKGNMAEALKRGFLIFCLIGFGVGVLANASFIIKGTNNVGKG
ncbi:CD3337/EF1877 family mobilome membrane protein, partial [Staphylococcus aureus]